jgi:preprotein translocase SecE subunit
VARNRKRAKERRTRRPPQAGGSQASNRSSIPGVLPDTSSGRIVTDEPSRELERGRDDNGAPDPLEHALPDVELAEAQLAAGRPAEPEPDDEADEEEFELEVEESITGGGGGRRGGRRDDGDGVGGEATGPAPAHVEHRGGMFHRLVGFLQGCWRELQRVQWPDRRQVMQATGVVIGFVIVAAAFLGLADLVAGKLVTFILK